MCFQLQLLHRCIYRMLHSLLKSCQSALFVVILKALCGMPVCVLCHTCTFGVMKYTYVITFARRCIMSWLCKRKSQIWNQGDEGEGLLYMYQ